jgi:hypothetical protein
MHKTISYILIAALGTWAGGAIPDSVRPSLPKVVAKVALTNQTGSIPATTLLTPTKSALYRISVYLVQVFPTAPTCDPLPGMCAVVSANFQWTDDGGTQVMSQPAGSGVSMTSPIVILLAPESGSGSCAASAGGTCVPAAEGAGGAGQLPGETFLVRDNAGKPLIYSVAITNQTGSPVGAYDFFMTVEQLE